MAGNRSGFEHGAGVWSDKVPRSLADTKRYARVDLRPNTRAVVQHDMAIDEVAEKRQVGDLAPQDAVGGVRGPRRPVGQEAEALGPDRHLNPHAVPERGGKR